MPHLTAPDDPTFELTLRPRSLEEYVGQDHIKHNLKIAIQAARLRDDAIDHLLLSGPPGLGKTTLAHLVAKELETNLRLTSGPAIERVGDLASILTNLEEKDILFIDEAHRLPRAVEEVLYPAMEAHALDIVLGKGTSARTLRLTLPRFTLIAATTRSGMLSSPLRSRFGQTFHFTFYSKEEIAAILDRSAHILSLTLEPEARDHIAQASRATPRTANRILKRIRDVAQVAQDTPEAHITEKVVTEGLKLLRIDEQGLEELDRAFLKTLIEKFQGGPTGIQALTAALNEDVRTLADMVEPYLLQIGFVERTNRGRVATRAAYTHLGLTPPPENQPLL